MQDGSLTRLHGAGRQGDGTHVVRKVLLQVVEGASTGLARASDGDRLAIGSHEMNDLVIDDDTVSRFHCEILVGEEGARVRDLGSLNGTVLDGVPVVEGFLRSGSLIRLGTSAIRFQLATESNKLVLSEKTRFGTLVGMSVPMRATLALLERAAGSDATVLLEGETGTGKGQAAESIHAASARAEAPFVVLDCSAVPANLLESEFFGHERGAFTGATNRRVGAFEAAHGGTIFLDEVGELPPELQPKLLRILENRELKRVGANEVQKVDVRVVAASNRDLRAEVNAGRFRADLYFRLAVVRIPMPPLRQRPEDLPVLVEQVLKGLRAPAWAVERFTAADFLARLERAAWPGNVRELRNYLERCLVLEDAAPADETIVLPEGASSDRQEAIETGSDLPYLDARDRAVATWEKRYLTELLESHGGKRLEAARAAGISRVYLYKLLRRHGIE